MAFSISAIIGAVDRFTGPVRRIMGVAGRAIGGVLTRIRGLAGRAAGALKSMLNPMALLGGAGAVGGLLAMTNSYAQAVDESVKFSRQIGVNVNSMRQLEYAFDRSGVAPEEFKDALKELNLRMGQLKAGEGSLLGFVDKVSPAFGKQLKGAKDNEEALRLLISAFRELEDPAARAALADAAFGGSGAKVARIADNTAEQLQTLIDQHKALAGTLSDDAGPQAEAFIDSMTNVKASLAGVKMQIASSLVPILTPLIERLAKWIAANRELIGTRVQSFIRQVGDAIDRVDWDLIVAGARYFWERLMDVRGVLASVADWIDATFGEGTVRQVLKFAGAASAVALGVSVVVGPFGRLVAIGGRLLALLGPLIVSTVRAGIAFLMTPAGWLTAALMGVAAAVGYVIVKWRELTGEANTFSKASPGLMKRLRQDVKFKQRMVEDAMAGNKASQQLLKQAFAGEFGDALWEEVNTQRSAQKRSALLEKHGLSGAGGAGSVQDPAALIAALKGQLPIPGVSSSDQPVEPATTRGGSLVSQVADMMREVQALALPTFGGDAGQPGAPVRVELAGRDSIEVGGELRVRFEGVPPGTRVTGIRSSNPAVPVVANVGRRSMAYGGP